MQQEKSSLSVAEYFRTPVDLSLSLCLGPNRSGVDRHSLMGSDFYAAEAFSCRGFLSQKVLIRFISFDDVENCLAFSGSPAFAKQFIVKVSDLSEDFLVTLKSDNKYPFLSQEDQSALKHDDQLHVQVIDYGQSLSVSREKYEPLSLLEKFISQVSSCLNDFRICPDSISLESFLITNERSGYDIKWIPQMPLNDLYTDKDISVLLSSLSCCVFFLTCSKVNSSLEHLYLQQLDMNSANTGRINDGITLDVSDTPEWEALGVNVNILRECIKLGNPFTAESYFDGSCSISESLNRFLGKIKLEMVSAENAPSSEDNAAIAEILSGLIEDDEWLSNVVIAAQKPIAIRELDSPENKSLGAHVVDDTVLLYREESSINVSGMEDSTLILGVNS